MYVSEDPQGDKIRRESISSNGERGWTELKSQCLWQGNVRKRVYCEEGSGGIWTSQNILDGLEVEAKMAILKVLRWAK